MSMNVGTYAVVSALLLGGIIAQQQYSKPAGPEPPTGTAEQQPPSSYSATPIPGSTGTGGMLDCNTLMDHHRQMKQELDKLDQQANDVVSQMHEAKTDRAKLQATMSAVELLVTQRKEIRDRMSMMEHETLQFMISNKSTDVTRACPQ